MELKGRDRKVKPDMDWNWNETTTAFLPQADPSYSFFYNYNNNNQNSGMEVKQPALIETSQRSPPAMDNVNNGSREKKRRLTNDQMELLERSFQEEIKLDPERKMKLSRELGLQPRQIAVWFQNRRSRWKTKQLENLYDVLRQEFDVISKEKHKLQQEVLMLKARLREQQCYRVQTLGGYTEISREETAESTSEALRGSNKSSIQQVEEGYCSFTMEDYNTVSIMPYYP